jgi:hypothetical protein
MRAPKSQEGYMKTIIEYLDEKHLINGSNGHPYKESVKVALRNCFPKR